MAEQLGEAVLKLSVDATSVDAAIQRSKQEVVAFGNSLRESLSRPIKPVDTKPLEAGLQRAKKEAEQAGKATEQAFTKTGRPIQRAANGLEYFIDANNRARKVTGQFVTVAELQAAGLDKLAGAAGRAGTSLDRLKTAGGDEGGGGGGLLALLGLNAAAFSAAAVGAAVVGIGAAAVQSAGSVQRLNAAFTGLTGSAEAAQQLQQDLFTLSKTTPFKNDEILTAAQRFLAVGVEADKLQGTINRIGSLAAQSGQPLERLALIYAQVYAKGRLQGEENLQLLEAGVDLTQELAVVTGKSGKSLQDAMSKGQISVEDFNKAVVLATGDMAALEGAGKAVDVAFANIADNVGQLFGGFAQSISPALSAAFGVVNQVLEQGFPSLDAIEEAFRPLTVEAERFSKVLAGNPELLAVIAEATRTWAEILVNNVANGLRAINNVLSRLDGKTLVQGFINAEFAARRVFLLLNAIGTTAVKSGELIARAISNPIRFGQDIIAGGGIGKFLEKEYAPVIKLREEIARARPIQFPEIKAGTTKALDGELSSKPGLRNTLLEQQQRARVQAELNDLTAKGLQDEIRYKEQVLELELQSLRNRQAISATTRTQLDGQQAILAAQRQVAQAEIALNAELAKPAEQRSSTEVDNLLFKVQEANAGVRKAYLDAGLALVQNARTAADALKGAQQNLNNIQRGGFEFLNREIQQQEINRARAAIQPLVDRGVIRQGIDISTPEKLFQLASFAEQLVPAQKQLEDAVRENVLATRALADKGWQVNVNVPGGTASGDVVGAINGAL